MGHTVADKKKLLDRVRRIKGQVDALEKALTDEKDCSAILHQIAGCRGAMNGLMTEVVEGHIQSHLAGTSSKSERSKAAQDLIELVKSYLK